MPSAQDLIIWYTGRFWVPSIYRVAVQVHGGVCLTVSADYGEMSFAEKIAYGMRIAEALNAAGVLPPVSP